MSLTQADVQNAQNFACEGCTNETFKQVFVIKKISALISKDGKETIVPIPIFACEECGHINEVFTRDLNINNKNNTTDNLVHVPV
jgi:uncharacterized Zn finger protein